MLTVSGLNVFHANLQVVWDLSFQVKKGELVTMIGPNGAGKTTTVETIVGLNRNATGSILLDGESILGSRPYDLFNKGLALVPEKREIFPNMPVIENLLLGGTGNAHRDKSLDRIFRLFPILKEREQQHAGTLSGGEQQMLAIGRALMSDPRLLILDDALSAVDTDTEARIFEALLQKLPDTTILLISHRISTVKNCNSIIVLKEGAIVENGTHEELLQQKHLYAELYNQQLLEEEILSLS